MANRLKMATAQSILSLKGLGWSDRRIARELGVNRETVGRYVRLGAAQMGSTGPPADGGPCMGDDLPAGLAPAPVRNHGGRPRMHIRLRIGHSRPGIRG